MFQVLDSILPPNLDPIWKNLLNGLFVFHILAFLLYLFVMIRSYVKARRLMAVDDLIE